ncbi:MAG: serine/threonine protein kinase [Chloroflexi bacterium]|nr:serine/threonine protein kinase [Chloroflexota bacterium]
MSFAVGENVGPYRIIEQLGQGGMATVFKAYHASLDRYVAIKVLHQAFNEDSTFLGRFQREARVVAKLEHPNIVPIYDYSEHEKRPYLVMKFIEGDTLKARLNKGPLSSQEIEQVVDSVGSALGHAHKQGILHRDIKPSNVLISTDGVMYLADFGLARIAQAGESTLSADSIMGTPQYISPEQAMGKKELDSGTDIYSFGVMLYEMVVGQVPFSADTPFSIIHDHIYTPLPLPMDINPNVPEPVQRVLLKALAKDRSDRYVTIEELCAAFKSAWVTAGVPMQGTAITMRPQRLKEPVAAPSVEQPAVKTAAAKSPAVKRSPWGWVAAGLVLILCMAVGLFAVRGLPRFRNQQPTKVPTSAPVLPTVPKQLPSPEAGVLPTPPQDLPPGVAAAYELVQKNPGDPDAHLLLSLALWDDGQTPASMEELAQASNLAGPTNKDFFLKAAHEFKAREARVPTAGMYMRLAPIYRIEGGEIPEEVMMGLRESVYKAAGEKNMPLFVFYERIDNVNLPLGYIARGRYALHHGSIEEAKLQLENADKLKPEMYEIPLLRAEIAIKEGRRDDARALLLSLSSDLGAPEWVRAMAEEFLHTLQ